MLLESSKQVFDAAGDSGVLPTSRCWILQRLAVTQTLYSAPTAETAAASTELQED